MSDEEEDVPILPFPLERLRRLEIGLEEANARVAQKRVEVDAAHCREIEATAQIELLQWRMDQQANEIIELKASLQAAGDSAVEEEYPFTL